MNRAFLSPKYQAYFSLCFFGGGGGGSSTSQTQTRNVAPSYAGGGDGGGAGVTVYGANNAGDISTDITGGNKRSKMALPGSNASPVVSASGTLSTAVQVNETNKTTAPVVNISTGAGSITAPQTASTTPAGASISLTWLNWLEIGAFALFGVYLFRQTK